jgi:dTDP-4-amino-4,6-dideoxygalactose transaminase
MFRNLTRRHFLAGAPAAGTALKTGVLLQSVDTASATTATEKPALLGGPKARKVPFDSWPKFDFTEEKALLDVLRSGHWFRGNGQNVKKFEESFAALTGAKQTLATCNGTAALFVSLNVVGVEPGDEVIVPPYTFIATVNTVLLNYALPVFVDTDPATFQMDHTRLEAALTPATRVIMPVHLGGNVCDLDAIGAIAAKHKIPVI